MGKPLAGQLGQMGQQAPQMGGGFQPQFGGGYGGGFQPQQGFGGFQPQFGGGYGGGFQPQSGGGYQPSRQRFNQMPQQMPMIGPGGGSRDFYDRQVQPQQQMFQQQMPQMFQQQMPQMFQQQMPQQRPQMPGRIDPNTYTKSPLGIAGGGAPMNPQSPHYAQAMQFNAMQGQQLGNTGQQLGPPAQRDEYNRLSAMSPEQRFSTLINQMGPEERGQYNAGIQQAAQDPSTQRQYDAFRSGQGQNMDPNLVRAIEGFRSSAPQQSGFGGQPQMQQTDPMQQAIQGGIRNGQFSPRALSQADMLGRLSKMTTVNSGAPTPQAPAAMIGAPQTDPRFRDGGAVTEDPRMQAMRGIQQLANRQRGFR